MILLTDKESKSYEMQKPCYICKNKFSNKVRDHCHYTGKFRVAAHNIAI